MKHNITFSFTVIALIISVYFYNNPYFIIGLVLFYLITTAFGSGLIQLNYFVNSINKGSNKGIAITFDDGPDLETTPQILAILAKENVKASFFVIGHKIEMNKELLQRIYDEGHTVGNHSFTHSKQTPIFSAKKLEQDIVKCSETIERVIKQRPLFFRPPFGVTNPRYKKALYALNLKSIGWSIRSLDTKTTDAKSLFKSVTKQITNGSILLFHDTQKVTVTVLPEIIKYCKDNGIEIVSLPKLINKKAYE